MVQKILFPFEAQSIKQKGERRIYYFYSFSKAFKGRLFHISGSEEETIYQGLLGGGFNLFGCRVDAVCRRRAAHNRV